MIEIYQINPWCNNDTIKEENERNKLHLKGSRETLHNSETSKNKKEKKNISQKFLYN